MSMDVPMSGRVPGIVGEVGNARQFPERNLHRQKRKSPPSEREEEIEAFDPSEHAADSAESDADESDGDGETGDLPPADAEVSALEDAAEREASADDDIGDLSPASTNGLTLTDVKAVYDSN
jgi:hypothetical protein